MSKSLSRKRQRRGCSGDKLDATSDDFEEENHQFRFHKRVKVEAVCSKKKKDTTKNTLSSSEFRNKSSSSKLIDAKDLIVDIEEDDVVFTHEKHNQPEQSIQNSLKSNDKEFTKLDDTLYSKEIFPSDNDHKDFIALEKSICSHSEKLCPTCKHIVESTEFISHFTECLKKFSYSKGKKCEDNAQKEEAFPCPVCLKALSITIQRSVHIKNCAQLHGLTSEQLILASRLQEKQIEERLSLGLPVQSSAVSDIGKSRTNKGVGRTAEKDPDLELAVALSYSLAEKEKGKREQEEDALLELGLPILIQEKRRTNQLAFLPSTAVIPQVKAGRRKRNACQQKTVLMTRSKEDREQIINEKVASILATKASFSETDSSLQMESKGVLKHFQDKNCTLWNFAHGDCNRPVEDNYVSELQNYIVPKELAVGGLLKHFSQVPGRLNFTVSMEDSEGQDTDDNEKQDNPEETIVDNYCTQLALAELLGSQENLAEFSLDEILTDENKEIKLNNDENDSIPSVNELSHSPKDGILTSIDLSSEGSVMNNSLSLTDNVSSSSKVQLHRTDNENISNPIMESTTSVIKSPQDVSLNICVNDVSTNTSFVCEYEEGKLSYMQSKLMADWNEVLASGEWCDIVILTKKGKFPCHSLVLHVRCPEIMNECYVKQNESQKLLNLDYVEHETVYKFLVYLYTGSVNIISKKEPSWMEMFDLAIKYNCKELISFLESIYKSPSTSIEHNTENYIDDKASEHNFMLTSVNSFFNSEEKPSGVTVIDVSPSPPSEPNLPSPNRSNDVTKVLENVGMTLRRNVDGLNSFDGTASAGRRSEFGCNNFSPDIFEETVNGGDFVETPVLTPPRCIESENEIKSPNEVQEDDFYIHSNHSMRRRQLFSNTISSSKASELDLPVVQISNKLPDKFDSPVTKYSSFNVYGSSPLQNSSVNDVDGIVDLTMSSDDSLENMPIQPDHNSDSRNEASLDQTLPFNSSSMLFSQNDPSKIYSPKTLNETLPRLSFDKQPINDLNNIAASNDSCMEEVIDISKDTLELCDKNLANCDEQEYNCIKSSSHSTKNVPCKGDVTLLSDKSKDLPQSGQREASPIVEQCSPPTKNDSYVSNVWDNFEDEGDYYFEYPTKDFGPLKQNNSPILKQIDLSPLIPIEMSPPLKQIENVQSDNCKNVPDSLNKVENSKTINKLYPLKDVSCLKEKNNSFSDVGNDTLLIAVAEVETQICSNSGNGVKENAPKTKKPTRFYKSKSCSLEDTTTLRPSASSLKTPVSFKKWGPHNITPMLDYKTMVSPELKKELDRYGIRKLSRKKAITLLTHIYDQLHPVVSDSEVDTSLFETPDKGDQGLLRRISSTEGQSTLVSPKKRRRSTPQKSPRKSPSSAEDLNTSRSSITSNEASGDECMEETAFLSDSSDDQVEISSTQQGSFESRMTNLIKLDSSLHEKVLLYEPVWANELHAAAKANGIKCSMPVLLDFLDRQCITFRLPTTRNKRKRGRKSPTKKSKHKAATQINT